MDFHSSSTLITPLPQKETSKLVEAYRHLCAAASLESLYEEERQHTSRYVHATSRGHEAIQVAVGMQLTSSDYVSPYYRDDALLLSLGFSPKNLLGQLLAKKSDIFSGGKHYYGHPSYRGDKHPNIIFQSSATGTQAIPAAGIGMGLKYLESQLQQRTETIVVCSMGDGAITAGEVSEALQSMALFEVPVLVLVQDNGLSITANSKEIRKTSVKDFLSGFSMKYFETAGYDFEQSQEAATEAVEYVREQRKPCILHAHVQLLGHHTSGVRKEFYRDVEAIQKLKYEYDPLLKLEKKLISLGYSAKKLEEIHRNANQEVRKAYQETIALEDPTPHTPKVFAPTPIVKEEGIRKPQGERQEVYMVEAGVQAIDELMEAHPEILYYGQDVGHLGGVFREAAGLFHKYGEKRVFNMPIQEAFTVGAMAGLAATGCKPIASIPFADYAWLGLNQLRTELAPSYYLTDGKWNLPCLLRIPVGAYGGGGPFHSGSLESVLLQIKGVKVVYPSNAADLKGLLKGAFYDPNPVVMLEHKGLYWGKGGKHLKTSMSVAPDKDYILPLGKGNIVQRAQKSTIQNGKSMVVITYGQGVHWALAAIQSLEVEDRVEVVDLRTLAPLDMNLVTDRVKLHSKALLITEEPLQSSFIDSLASQLTQVCFEYLDAPIKTIGAKSVPAIPLNIDLENDVLPTTEKVAVAITELLAY